MHNRLDRDVKVCVTSGFVNVVILATWNCWLTSYLRAHCRDPEKPGGHVQSILIQKHENTQDRDQQRPFKWHILDLLPNLNTNSLKQTSVKISLSVLTAPI